MDKDTIGAVGGAFALLGLIAHWIVTIFMGGRKAAEAKADTLQRANHHTDREVEKVRIHTSVEHDKLWTEVRQLRQEANADRVAVAKLEANVLHIRDTTDRILAKLDKRSTD